MVDFIRYYAGRARFRFAMIVATWAASEIERTLRQMTLGPPGDAGGLNFNSDVILDRL